MQANIKLSIVKQKQLCRREGVFSGLHSLMDPKSPSAAAAAQVQVERKVETMITAPAAGQRPW